MGDPVPIMRTATLAQLVPDPNNPRHTLGPVDNLAEILEASGWLNPLWVRPPTPEERRAHPRSGEWWMIIAGHRRRAAIEQLIAAGKWDRPIDIIIVESSDHAVIQLAENMGRRPLHWIEIAQQMHRIREEHGYTRQQAAALVGVSTDSGYRMLRAWDGLKPDVRERILSRGDVGYNQALRAKNLSSEEQTKLLWPTNNPKPSRKPRPAITQDQLSRLEKRAREAKAPRIVINLLEYLQGRRRLLPF